MVLSYVKNNGMRRAISSGNPEELDNIWQPQIKDGLKNYLGLFHKFFDYSFHMFSVIYACSVPTVLCLKSLSSTQSYLKYTQVYLYLNHAST